MYNEEVRTTMKKYIVLTILIISCIWIHYYSIDVCETQDSRISYINTNNTFNREEIFKLELEDSIKNKDKIDSLKIEIKEDEENLSDAYKQLKFYNNLKNTINMNLIFFLIGASSLIYWFSHRNDEPTHPKLFWTLIFGWLYILYYVCDKKGL